ncbi:homoserine O-acetyltransferase MetX [Rhodothermus marinus]|uniref:Homoserine O-acetyltransferase n=1 Tax=Rhodothermus marinus (strain ATCC 43812 / DSM 4252 / R-10) TaxID=518766 RepID=D0MH39_RHOM4|nr:homoserine O-acetyltransferase [Rhodothermus marinus]ACY47824.1 homoserine O-acetyltransferase [Rhodothermus marinus DSM 4252]
MTQTFVLPEFELESGVVLRQVQVAYRTWGRLNPEGTNALVVCHALTGSADVDQWWGDLLGPGRAFDTDRFFVVCANVLGSPYGTTSPLTINPDTGRPYGPEFPLVTIRDTVNLHRRLLEHLGVRQVAVAVGGSMGGMQVLEWAFQGDFVRAIIPIAVGGRHSAWCIGWSEAQRQAIYADPRWRGGYYDPDDPPVHGLAIARMIAMISYRSYQSFEARFGRRRMLRGEQELFAVESYLHYQGEKLVRRFDANCYVRLTQKMDAHDVSRGRGPYPEVLAEVRQPALVVGIDSDVLYPLAEQEELATHLPNASLYVLHSPHGHDAFLIETQTLNEVLREWISANVPVQAAPSPWPSSETAA